MAVQRKYIPKSMTEVACKGYRGVLTQLSLDGNGQAHIANICGGTNVGDLTFHLNRPRDTDDFSWARCLSHYEQAIAAFAPPFRWHQVPYEIADELQNTSSGAEGDIDCRN